VVVRCVFPIPVWATGPHGAVEADISMSGGNRSLRQRE